MLQNERMLVEELQEKLANASRKVLAISPQCQSDVHGSVAVYLPDPCVQGPLLISGFALFPSWICRKHLKMLRCIGVDPSGTKSLCTFPWTTVHVEQAAYADLQRRTC